MSGTDAGVGHAALEALAADARLGELGRYVPPLSLPRAFGVERDEVAHSRVLAELLDPARHAAAETLLRPLLREVARLLGSGAGDGGHKGISEALGTLADRPLKRVAVRRESMLIDVVVEVSGPGGEAVVGIENKIDAAEQPDQIARYQTTLSRAYPGRAAAMVFLTPTGRPPATAAAVSGVPVVPLGYGWLARALSEARRAAVAGREDKEPDGDPDGDRPGLSGGGRDGRVLRELEEHVREEILGEGEARPQDLVRGLWREHGRALRLAIEHRPRLADVGDGLAAELAGLFGDDAHVYFWGRGRDLKEVKMEFHTWREAGFPFTFCVRAYEGERPQARALVWKDAFGPRADDLRGWARGVNASLGPGAEPLLDEGFARIRGWDWHKVFREEDWPASAELSADAFDGETVREAVGAVVALVELLRPHVEDRP